MERAFNWLSKEGMDLPDGAGIRTDRLHFQKQDQVSDLVR